MKFKASGVTKETLRERVRAALGETPCDLVVRGAKILDVFGGSFTEGTLAIKGGVIVGSREAYEGSQVFDAEGCYVVPGFVDAHVHVESSLATPLRFQQAVLPRGTTTALWDPHEIANVHGTAGIEWALSCADDCAQNGGIDLFVLVPSCVPATHLETSGAILSASDLAPFRNHPRVLGLAEFMNVPGVLSGDAGVAEKLDLFSNGIRDGHAPQLRGRALNAYLCAGIHGCHESTTREEASEKLAKGMHVLIREGSCAKDAPELLPLVTALSSSVLALCSDDRNPADIRSEGHIDHIVALALKQGMAPELAFRVASFGAARSYGLFDRGVLAPGYLADAVVVKPRKAGDWTAGFDIRGVVKAGHLVDAAELERRAAEGSERSIPRAHRKNIHMAPLREGVLSVPCVLERALPRASLPLSKEAVRVSCRVIGVQEGQLLSEARVVKLPVVGGLVQSAVEEDVLKIGVFERHHATGNVGVGFVSGFGLKCGAIAASIGHDCHNITCVGVNDTVMHAAVEAIGAMDGGIVVVGEKGEVVASLALPVGGLMTHAHPDVVADALVALKAAAASQGCALEEPFLLMSFMALPVIPALKLTDKGLVDVEAFTFVPVVCEESAL
jgi:adenine deaminase